MAGFSKSRRWLDGGIIRVTKCRCWWPLLPLCCVFRRAADVLFVLSGTHKQRAGEGEFGVVGNICCGCRRGKDYRKSCQQRRQLTEFPVVHLRGLLWCIGCVWWTNGELPSSEGQGGGTVWSQSSWERLLIDITQSSVLFLGCILLVFPWGRDCGGGSN